MQGTGYTDSTPIAMITAGSMSKDAVAAGLVPAALPACAPPSTARDELDMLLARLSAQTSFTGPRMSHAEITGSINGTYNADGYDHRPSTDVDGSQGAQIAYRRHAIYGRGISSTDRLCNALASPVLPRVSVCAPAAATVGDGWLSSSPFAPLEKFPRLSLLSQGSYDTAYDMHGKGASPQVLVAHTTPLSGSLQWQAPVQQRCTPVEVPPPADKRVAGMPPVPAPPSPAPQLSLTLPKNVVHSRSILNMVFPPLSPPVQRYIGTCVSTAGCNSRGMVNDTTSATRCEHEEALPAPPASPEPGSSAGSSMRCAPSISAPLLRALLHGLESGLAAHMRGGGGSSEAGASADGGCCGNNTGCCSGGRSRGSRLSGLARRLLLPCDLDDTDALPSARPPAAATAGGQLTSPEQYTAHQWAAARAMDAALTSAAISASVPPVAAPHDAAQPGSVPHMQEGQDQPVGVLRRSIRRRTSSIRLINSDAAIPAKPPRDTTPRVLSNLPTPRVLSNLSTPGGHSNLSTPRGLSNLPTPGVPSSLPGSPRARSSKRIMTRSQGKLGLTNSALLVCRKKAGSGIRRGATRVLMHTRRSAIRVRAHTGAKQKGVRRPASAGGQSTTTPHPPKRVRTTGSSDGSEQLSSTQVATTRRNSLRRP
jgi:hypothetical protein